MVNPLVQGEGCEVGAGTDAGSSLCQSLSSPVLPWKGKGIQNVKQSQLLVYFAIEMKRSINASVQYTVEPLNNGQILRLGICPL